MTVGSVLPNALAGNFSQMKITEFVAHLRSLQVIACGVSHEEDLTPFGSCGLRATNLACCHQRHIDGGGDAASTLRAAIALAESLGKPLPDLYQLMLRIGASVHALFDLDEEAAAAFYPHQGDHNHPQLPIIREKACRQGLERSQPITEAHRIIVDWFDTHIVPDLPRSQTLTTASAANLQA